MATAHHICRLAAVEDIRRTAPLWAQDRPLFDADVWARMPALLSELLQSESVKLAIIESVPARQPRLLGAVSFIEPEYIAEALTSGSTLPNTVMRAALDRRNPFLTPDRVAETNAHAELHLMNFFGNISALDLRKQEMANFYEVSNRGYQLLHYGYAYRAMWVEVWPPHHVVELESQGMHIERQMKLRTGETSTLLSLTRDRALENPYARRCGLFFPPAPRFRFARGEQTVLELTIQGLADDEIADCVHVSMDAIKKRWRSIYAKVANADPGLLAAVDSGVAQRRELLNYLELHLEELRPYAG